MKTIIIDNEERRARALAVLSKVPLAPVLQVTIEEYDPTRSGQQNRRYWLLLRAISGNTGHDVDEIHELLKMKFLGKRAIEIAGERAVVSPSTRKLKVKEFKEYMDKVEGWAIENLGVWLE